MSETFGIGNVLGTGFRIWAKNIVAFLLLTTLLYSPLIVWGLLAVRGEPGLEQLERVLTFSRYGSAAMVLLNIFVAAALTYGVVMELQGKHASIGACISTGFARFFPVLGVALLSAIAVVGGIILLIVPGVIVMCMLYVATPASVIERPGVMGALKRSRELTAGHKGAIFGLVLILGALAFGMTKLVEAITIPHASDPAHVEETLRAIPVYMYADLARAIIVGSIGSVMAAVAYYYLRNSKEGTSAQELAKVFE
jgi:hypothetical protein